jgi:hypothetical protein
LGEPLVPGLPGAFETLFLHQPLAVVGVHEAPDCGPHLIEVLEKAAMDDLLFDGPVEAFGHAIGLWLFNEGETGVNAPVFQLVLKMI